MFAVYYNFLRSKTTEMNNVQTDTPFPFCKLLFLRRCQDTQTNTDCSLFECALSGCEEGQQDISVCAVYTKVRKCESHATEADLI